MTSTTFHLTFLCVITQFINFLVSTAVVPEQVHISLGTNASELLVTWHTLYDAPKNPVVEYGFEEAHLIYQSDAEVSHYEKIHLYTYRALLVDLKPLTPYYYRVGTNASWSPTFRFRSISDDPQFRPTLAIYGDLGYQNEESLPFLEKDVNANLYDAIFHAGDIGYDLYERGGEQGNDFMRSIESIAARVCYLTCPGNHEKRDNFSHYDVRFSMLGDRSNPNHHGSLKSRINNFYHSMDIGPLHIIMFSTEFYFYTDWGWEQIKYQYEWLEQDLIRANQNRDKRPWILVMGHRPLYCLKLGDTSCNLFGLDRKRIRTGIQMYDNETASPHYGLEELFYKYSVDLQVFGHEHFYGLLFPVYNHKIKLGSSDNPYENAEAPIHIISGSAGNRELHPPVNPLVWYKKLVASHHYDYGYTRLKVVDRLKILVEQISVDKGGIVIDQVEISKSTEQPKWAR